MTNSQKTRRALLASALSLILCFTMLLGTTYAWFTDSVTSGKNTIVAGNLDVELYYQNDETSDWTKVDEESNIFKKGTLWEPGHTEVIKLKVANEGTLAMKYQFAINIVSETTGINKDGKPFRLSDYIYFGLADGELEGTRDQAIDAVEAVSKKLNGGISVPGTLEKGEESIVTLVVYMPTTVGNEANYMTGTNIPQIDLGLHVYATQYTSEADSFDKYYDKDTAWTGAVDTSWYSTTATEFTLDTAEDLAGLAEIVNSGKDTFAGKTVNLGADIDLNNVAWTPIGNDEDGWNNKFDGSFIGTGYTISNLYVTGTTGLGLFGYVGSTAHIEGVTIDGAYISGNDYVGAVMGSGYLDTNCLKNCTVTGATIIATPVKLADGTYDGGAKAGVIAGYAINGHVIGNTAKNSTVIAYRDLGGIVGMLAGENHPVEATGNTVDETVKLSYIGVAGKYDGGKVNENMNDIVGRVGNNVTVENNNGKVTKNEANANATMIFTLEELIAFAKDVNAGNDYKGKTVLLGADIDLANMNWTPIGGNSNPFKGTFDGNGKTISNLKVTFDPETTQRAALFGQANNATIKNINVNNVTATALARVAAIVGGATSSTIENCHVTGDIDLCGYQYVGAIVGNGYVTIKNCSVAGTTDNYAEYTVPAGDSYGKMYMGGIVGWMGEGNSSISGCSVKYVNMTTNGCVGAVTGLSHYGNTIANCTAEYVNITANSAEQRPGTVGLVAGACAGTESSPSFFNNNKTANVVATDGGKAVSAMYGTDPMGNGTVAFAIVDGKYDGKWAVTDIASLENALTKGGEAKVYKDVKLTEYVEIPEGVTVTLDMNGKKMSTTGGIALYSQGDLTITGEGQISSVSGYAIRAQKGKLTVDSDDIVVSSQFGAVSVFNGAEVTINGGSYTNTGVAGKTSHVVYLGGYGTININGGSFVRGADGDSGGVIVGYGWKNDANEKAIININGGYIGCETNWGFISNYDAAWTEINATGGTFSANPSKYVADGYTATELNGVFYVTAEAVKVVKDADSLVEALESGKDVLLVDDTKIDPAGMSNAYGTTGINVKNGQTIDGNGNTLDIKGAGGTWDSGINTTGGLIKNITVTGSFRGIFINHNGTAGKVYLENVIIDGTTYTISCDQGTNSGLEATNCTFNGWTSYAATLGPAKFVGCSFGEGNGYAYCRPYAPTTFVGCEFEAGFEMDPRAAVTFENCTIGGVALTAENLATLVTSNIANATVIA